MLDRVALGILLILSGTYKIGGKLIFVGIGTESKGSFHDVSGGALLPAWLVLKLDVVGVHRERGID